MKLKGINPIEQHVEKVLVGVVLVIFLAVVGLQFVSGGNTIDVGSQKDVPIDRAYQELANLAQARLAQLQDESVDPSVPTEFEDPTAAIAESWSNPTDAPDSLPIALGIAPQPLRAEDDVRDTSNGGLPRVLAVMPEAPTKPIVQNYAAAIDPLLVESNPDIQAIAPAAQPYDMRSVTIAAEFDAPALLADLRLDPDDDGPLQAIPGFWWQGGKLQIVDVEVERQVVYENGEFGPTEIIEPMPGRATFREQFEGIDAAGMQTLVQAARLSAREVVQPRFYGIISGEPWALPADGDDNLSTQIDALVRQLKAERARIADLKSRLEQANAEQELMDLLKKYVARQTSRGGGRGGGQGDRGSEGDTAAQREEAQREKRAETINKQIADAEAKEAVLVQQLQDLGFDPDANEPPDPMAELANIPALVTDGEPLRIWAHDLSAEPGVTYRYRMRVVVNNPLFSFAENVAEEDQDQAAEPFLRSEASTWSEPVRVDDDVYWFVTRATPGGDQAIGRVAATCTAEIYKFYYGYWRRAETRLQAGDVAFASLDLAAQALPIYTILQRESGPQVDEQFTTIDTPIPVDSSVVVLDVRASAVSTRRDDASEEVVVRDANGQLAVRRPDVDLVNELRRRLESSASLGLGATVRAPSGVEGELRQAADAPQPGRDPAAADQQPAEDAGRGRPGGRGG